MTKQAKEEKKAAKEEKKAAKAEKKSAKGEKKAGKEERKAAKAAKEEQKARKEDVAKPAYEKPPLWVTRLMAERYGRRAVLKATIVELIFYLIFLTAVVTVSVGSFSSSMYYLTRAMQIQFTDTPFQTIHKAQITFPDIKTSADFWYYAEYVLGDVFYWDHWYDSENSTAPAEDDDKKILYENKVLGVARLRQLKVRSDSCTILDYVQSLFEKCFGHYSWSNQDTDSFGPENGTAWTYSSDIGGSPFLGKLAWYHTGGFYQDLSTESEQTKEIIKSLKQNLWITRGTRLVVVDFTVYNGNLDLFSVCKLVFEFSPAGGILPWSHFETLRIMKFKSLWDFILLGMRGVMATFAVFYTFEKFREIVYFKLKYFTMFWNYMDMTILLFLYLNILLTVIYFFETRNLDDLIHARDEYADFEMIAQIEAVYDNIAAILTFLTFIKLFKYLSFNRTLGQLNATIGNCAWEIFGFILMFFIVFIAFAIFGFLVFGAKAESFKTVLSSMFTLLRTILGDFDYTEIEHANQVIAPIFFITYIFFVFFVLLNMFLAIINDTYADVKAEIAAAPNKDSPAVTDFAKNLMKNRIGFFRRLFRKKPPKTVVEDDYNPNIIKIKEVLKECGFNEPEIEMFFQRYNIDPTAQVDDYEMYKLIDNLGRDVDQDVGLPIVRVSDFLEQQELLRQIQRAVKGVSVVTASLIERLEYVYRVNKEAHDEDKPNV